MNAFFSIDIPEFSFTVPALQLQISMVIETVYNLRRWLFAWQPTAINTAAAVRSVHNPFMFYLPASISQRT
jgi:hypothetical protein